jgi:hypothetical protein
MIICRVHHAPAASAGEGREHRIAPRIKVGCSLEMELESGPASGHLIDLSTTGAAIAHDNNIELGEVLPIRFDLDGQQGVYSIACAGLVRGIRKGPLGSVYGLEFHNLSPADRKFLATHIRWVQAGGDLAEAREHWSNNPDPGAASVVTSSLDPERKLLRWVPGFGNLFAEIAGHILDNDNIFVPATEAGLFEGEVLYLELVPPQSHLVFRSLVEVTWVQLRGESGVGLRLPTLTTFDRQFLENARSTIAEPMTLS